MAKPMKNAKTVTLDELVVSQSFEIAALVPLLEKKGIFTRQEIIEESKSLKKSRACP